MQFMRLDLAYEGFFSELSSVENLDAKCINKAINIARNIPGHENALNIGLNIALVAKQMQLDTDSTVVAILYRLVRTEQLQISDVKANFSEDVFNFFNSLLKITDISTKITHDNSQEQIENLRKMIIAVVTDVRIILIKLAERLCAARMLYDEPDKNRQERVINEISHIYAPLSHRLGIGSIKWELEDLVFRYQNPKAYEQIALLLSERRIDREQYIDSVINTLHCECQAAGINVKINGRVKHIYSIWRKMHLKNKHFNQIYDVRAVRVLVDNIKDCYSVLGIVHSVYRYMPKEFDDYIASPKPNGYRSLHTIVIGEEDKVFEIQIRTKQMHEEAELGICAHHLYKGIDNNNASAAGYNFRISQLRDILANYIDEHNNIEEREIERVYVFTPENKAVNLPYPSTPIDFAYRIHTELGNKCKGAKVNGKMTSLTYVLQMGDTVEIIKANNSHPSRDWLNPANGYVLTSRARSKVMSYFRSLDKEQNIVFGKNMFDKMLPNNLKSYTKQLDLFLNRFGSSSADEFYLNVAFGDIKATTVNNFAKLLHKQQNAVKADEQISHKTKIVDGKEKSDILIVGVSDLLTTTAGCCNPIPGDNIVGFVTAGRGISIHRSNCKNLIKMQVSEPDRIIDASFANTQMGLYTASVTITAQDRNALIADISEIMRNEKIGIKSMNTQLNTKNSLATIHTNILVKHKADLCKLINQLAQVTGIFDVIRR